MRWLVGLWSSAFFASFLFAGYCCACWCCLHPPLHLHARRRTCFLLLLFSAFCFFLHTNTCSRDTRRAYLAKSNRRDSRNFDRVGLHARNDKQGKIDPADTFLLRSLRCGICQSSIPSSIAWLAAFELKSMGSGTDSINDGANTAQSERSERAAKYHVTSLL